MKLPRDLSGSAVVAALERIGFTIVRQTGSHIQLSFAQRRVTVPNHNSIAPGTLKSVLRQAEIDLTTFLDNL